MKTKTVFFTITLIFLSTIVSLVFLEVISYFILKLGPEAYYEKDYTNSLGLRDSKEPAQINSNNVILVLGDSFTYGLGVTYEDSYPVILEKKLNKAFPNSNTVVINGGIPGYDTQLEYQLMERVFNSYKPDYIIVGFHSADIMQNQIAYKKFKDTNNNNLTDKQTQFESVKSREIELPKLLLFKHYIFKISKTAKLFNFLYKNYLITYFPPPQAMLSMRSGEEHKGEFKSSEYFLNKIYDFALKNNSKMIVLSIVPLVNYQHYPYEHINSVLNEYSEKRNIYFINPLSVFSKYSSSDLWVSWTDGHYNRKANDIVADVVCRYFIENKIITTDKFN